MYIKVDNQQSVEDFKTSTKKGVWIILYYASWCPHCQSMKPEWEKFASKYSSVNNGNVNVADVESEYLEKIGQEHKQNVVGFPTIVSCKNGRKVSDFNGPRTSDEIDKFANSNSTVAVDNSTNNTNHIQQNNTQALINTILKVGKTGKAKKTGKVKKSKSKKIGKSKKSKKSKKSRK